MRTRVDGAWADVTWRDYGEQVRRVARGLLALGFREGDRLAILSSNRPEWFYADVACMSLRGTTAPVYTTNSPPQVAHVIAHSRAKVAIVEDDAQLDKVLRVLSQLPELRHVIVIQGGDGSTEREFVLGWRDLLERADDVGNEAYEDVGARLRDDDVATFVYTSGTTGPPKAVILTHANIWWTCEALQSHLRIEDPPNSRALSYLPLSHIAERMVSHMINIYFGSQTWFAASMESVRADLVDCRPTYFFGVPRVWERFHAAVLARLEEEPGSPRERIERALLRHALAAGRKVVEAEQAAVRSGRLMAEANVSPVLRAKHLVWDRIVLSKARSRAGMDQCTRPFSAAAPIDPEVVWFLHSLGIKVAEGYGQSETTGPTTWNPPDAILIGSVGVALPGLQLRLADDGEILVKGGNVSPGYFEDPEATRELLDEQGWLHSGDIGALDGRGYLTISDRKKDLIITSGGKNVAPQDVENRLRLTEPLSQVVVVGDGRPFLTALVTLDDDKAAAWARERGIEGDIARIARHERTLKEIDAAVGEVNAGLARAEQIKKVRILEEDFTQERDEITPTLKVRRRKIADAYAEVIEEMYDRSSPTVAAARLPGT